MASVSKVIHTDSQLHAEQFGKTAYTEWIRYARLLQQSNLDGAIADFDRTIQLDPTIANAFTARGLAYEKKGENDRAKADFNTALGIPPKCGSDGWAHDVAKQRLAPPPTEPPLQPFPEDTFVNRIIKDRKTAR